MPDQVIIDAQYNGPPDSGNGGYCCGVFALAFNDDPGHCSEVTLRKPVPLNKKLLVEATSIGGKVSDGNELVAEVAPTQLELKPLPGADAAAAEAAQAHYSGFHQHPFPGCFVCGPERHEGDGLRLFTGALAHTRAVASLWHPYPELADKQGNIRPEFVWAALDCPSYFGAFIDKVNAPALLGRQAVELRERVLPANKPYIVQAWPLYNEGRKHFGASALYNTEGHCLALCQATWIAL